MAVSDDAAKVWLNNRQIAEEDQIQGPGVMASKKIPMTLAAGWNHLLVKIGQLDSPWSFSARLECSRPDLLARLRVSPVLPHYQANQ